MKGVGPNEMKQWRTHHSMTLYGELTRMLEPELQKILTFWDPSFPGQILCEILNLCFSVGEHLYG